MDTVAHDVRSRMMAGIHGKDTKPERLVRLALFARGFRFRKNIHDLPGKPDIKLTKHRAVIFIHGCFWHGHDCRYYRVPASNVDFWKAKIAKNRQRDARDILALRDAGWRACVVWECVTRKAKVETAWSSIIDILSGWIQGDDPFLELFDPQAMRGPPAAGTEASTGVNADADLFVAERNPAYGQP